MIKYSYELKKEIVKAYQNGEGGYGYLAKKYEIKNGDKKQVQKWVKAYEVFGDEGLMRSRKKKKYSFEFKMNVVELYLTTEVSYGELALSVGINNPSIVAKWINDFRVAGSDALREKSKGRKLIMPQPTKTTTTNETIEYLKQVEEENLKLRIENAYLKELRRLRLEEEALNTKRELLVASEDNSD